MDQLLLISGNDIPFPEASITIHVPKIKEIAFVGEENFFTGYQLLLINKNLLIEEDKVNLEKLTNFDILIAILEERNAVMQKNRNCLIMVLALLFPNYLIKIGKDKIELINEENKQDIHILNHENFDIFQKILKNLFNSEDTEGELKPVGEISKRIADKLKKRHQKLAEIKPEQEEIEVIGRYASILAIGLHLDLNSVMNYTLYQMFDQIKRFELKSGYDIYTKAKMAGASDLKDPED